MGINKYQNINIKTGQVSAYPVIFYLIKRTFAAREIHTTGSLF